MAAQLRPEAPPFGETATVHGDAGPIMSSAVALMRLSKLEAVCFSSSCTGMMKVLKNLMNVDVFLCVYICMHMYIQPFRRNTPY